MPILIYEHFCATGREELPAGGETLPGEGLAMLRGVVEDFVAGGEEVWTLWHCSWGASPWGKSVKILSCDLSTQPERVLWEGLQQCEAALIIAPESEGVLERLTREVEKSGCRLLGCGSEGVHLAGDKWELFRHFEAHNVSTVPTTLIETEKWVAGEWAPETFPCAVKPRFGAGSQETFVLRDAQELERLRPELMRACLLAGGICQPFIEGDAVSVAVWCDSENGVAIPFPMGRQRLSDDGRLKYRGGLLPCSTPGKERCEALAARACQTVPGLRGYVGVDLIVPKSEGAVEPLVVEINPRLTTSSVGYRQLAKQNLSRCWREPEAAKLVDWKSGQIQFDSTGTWKWLSEGGVA